MLASTTAKNKALDAAYGDARSSTWPATVYVALFDANPSTTGTELTSTGSYARATLANNGPASSGSWNNASGGSKTNQTDIVFPTSSGAWSATATHFCLMDASTGGNKLDGGALTSSITVSVLNTIVKILAGQLTLTAA